MRSTDFVTPETSSNWNYGQFCQDDGATDGGGYFLGTLHSKPNVSIVISDSNKSLESCTLSSTSLFLNGHNLEDFIFQRGSEEKIDDFKFFDGQREEVDFFQALDLSIFDQSAKLGDGNPFFFVFASTSAATTTTSTSPATTTTSSATTTKSTSETSTIGWSCVRHVITDRM